MGQCPAILIYGSARRRLSLINRNSNRCLDVANASNADGTNILQWGCFETAPQQTFRLVDFSATGLETQTASETMVYPNPSHGSFTIHSDENQATANIFNFQGQKVFEAAISSGENEINTQLTPGLYLLQVASATNTFTQKIVVQ
ncbi:T9SS type A sorting domain-containing protein [Geofilum rubicundum]|uniref:T9SS type A sorting domain-containing protein n=1 Tax=Geofilum rubicundum TaxID=472113 RepID=UPI001D0EAF33